jgi:hypothetical protein
MASEPQELAANVDNCFGFPDDKGVLVVEGVNEVVEDPAV